MSTMKNKIKSLLPSKHFFIGVGSIFDLSGTSIQSHKRITDMSDAEALRMDWQTVGLDFASVIEETPYIQLKLTK